MPGGTGFGSSSSDGTTLNPGSGGQTMATEAAAQGSLQVGTQISRSKGALGPLDIDDGDVSDDNPMPVASASIEAKLDRIIELLEYIASKC